MRGLAAIAGLFAWLVLPAAAGAIPVTLTHTGYLLGVDDRPVDAASVSFGLRIVDFAATDPGEHATFTATCATAVNAGYYALAVGSAGCGAGLDSTDVSAIDPRWLELTVGGVTLSPRVRLTPAPTATYASEALHAGDADTLGHVAAALYALKTDVPTAGAGLVATGGALALDTTAASLAKVSGGHLSWTGTTIAANAGVAVAGDVASTTGAFQGSGAGLLNLGSAHVGDASSATLATALGGSAPSGTAGALVKFATGSTFGNSIASESGSTLTVAGTLAATAVADATGSLAAVRAGGLALPSQASLDFLFAASPTQLGRLAAGTALQVPRINAAGTGWEFAAIGANRDVCNGRLTLESGVPVSTTDQSSRATLYFTPYRGNQLGLYDGAAWSVFAFTERSLGLAGFTAARPIDVFAFNNAGTVTLEGVAWTNTTTRATGLVLQDGVYVKSGAPTRRYLGTVEINPDGISADDMQISAGVWNACNRVRRPLLVTDATASWTWVTPGGTFRSARNLATNAVTVVVGLAGESEISLTAATRGSLDDAQGVLGAGIGINSSTTNAAQVYGALGAPATIAGAPIASAHYVGAPAIGRQQYRWLEYGASFSGLGTATFAGSSSYFQVGMFGEMDR